MFTPGAYAFRYDVTEENGKTIIYSRDSDLDSLALATSESIKTSVITSTTQNPAFYTQKLELNSLVEFLREDWEKQGISTHYER